MKFDLKNPVQRKIFIYSTSLIIGIIAFLILTRVNDLIHFLGTVVSLLAPFLIGFGLAFLLDGPVNWISNRLMSFGVLEKKARSLSILIVVILFILFIIFTFWVMIPSLLDSVRVFVSNFSGYSRAFEVNLEKIAVKYNLDVSAIVTYLQSLDLAGMLRNYVQSSMTKVMSYSMNVIHWAANLFIAIAAAVYMIMDKENLLHAGKVMSYAFLGRKNANFLQIYMMDVKNIFQQYIVGNIMDSVIVGFIAWFGCTLFGFPYTPMIGLIIGITNIIPVFGPFMGAIPVGLLLFLINPMDALIFAVFILIVQQVDGNVLKPLILGDKLGISGFWILFSVSVGGSLFGVIGMFLGVPVFALIYEGLKDLTALQLKDRHMVISDSASIVDDDESVEDQEVPQEQDSSSHTA